MTPFPAWCVLIALLALFVFAGCTKEDSPTEPDAGAPTTVPTVTFKGPNTNSQDPHAQLTKTYVVTMNTFSSIFVPYANLPATRSGNTSTWSYTDRTLTYTFTGTVQGDGSVRWKLVLKGTDPIDGTVYNNWTAIEGTTSGDGKNGSWKIYEDNSTTLEAEYSWTTSSTNELTGTLKVYDAGTLESQSVVVNKADGSGELRLYEGTRLVYKAVWQANGSGQWWEYDLNGNQIGTGTWT